MTREWRLGMAARAYIGGRDPVAPGVGDRPPFNFFRPWTSLQIWRKKITSRACAPHRATGGSFEIFQNGHIFLKFWFFLNIKKKRTPEARNLPRPFCSRSHKICSELTLIYKYLTLWLSNFENFDWSVKDQILCYPARARMYHIFVQYNGSSRWALGQIYLDTSFPNPSSIPKYTLYLFSTWALFRSQNTKFL